LLLVGLVTAVGAAADQEVDKAVSLAGVPVMLVEKSHFRAQRLGRFVLVTLKTPHRVLSTSRFLGGQTVAVKYLVNHQSMESKGDLHQFEKILTLSSEEYQSAVAAEIGIDPTQMVLMGTAANMHHLAHVGSSYRDLQVDAFVTAGVKGNATRAGDPARWFQGDSGYEHVPYK